MWSLVVDGLELAILQHPAYADMFWTSYEIVPSTPAPDPRLADDAFWWSDRWRLFDIASGRVATRAVASSAGLQRSTNRVVLRGLHG